MDPKLFDNLLGQMTVLIDRIEAAIPHLQTDNNPLHTAALHGLSELASTIVDLRPEFVLSFNKQGLTPIHLAAAKGHFKVVHEMLSSKIGSDLCLLKDRNGLLPIHTAAMKGKVTVLMELIYACPSSLLKEPLTCQEPITCRKDTILHLAVKSGCFDAVEFLVKELGWYSDLLNFKNEEGNTILHLAVQMKQYETVKLLLSKPMLDKNAKNEWGLTALDIIIEQSQDGPMDLTMEQMIRGAAGGRRRRAITTVLASNFKVLLSIYLRFHKVIAVPIKLRDDKYKETRNTLIVVDTLIATFTFQAVVNPPTVLTQEGSQLKLKIFLWCDMISFFASIGVILLILTNEPRTQFEIRVLMLFTWAAIAWTGLAFLDLVPTVFDPNNNLHWLSVQLQIWQWTIIVYAVILLLYVFSTFSMKMHMWFEKKKRAILQPMGDIPAADHGNHRAVAFLLHHPRFRAYLHITVPVVLTFILINAPYGLFVWFTSYCWSHQNNGGNIKCLLKCLFKPRGFFPIK